MPDKTQSNETIPRLVRHFVYSCNDLIQEGAKALQSGDRATLDRLASKAAGTHVVKLIANMVMSSREHCLALTAQANLIGNNSHAAKGLGTVVAGIVTMLLGMYGGLPVAFGTLVVVVGLLLMAIGVVTFWDAAVSRGMKD